MLPLFSYTLRPIELQSEAILIHIIRTEYDLFETHFYSWNKSVSRENDKWFHNQTNPTINKRFDKRPVSPAIVHHGIIDTKATFSDCGWQSSMTVRCSILRLRWGVTRYQSDLSKGFSSDETKWKISPHWSIYYASICLLLDWFVSIASRQSSFQKSISWHHLITEKSMHSNRVYWKWVRQGHVLNGTTGVL